MFFIAPFGSWFIGLGAGFYSGDAVIFGLTTILLFMFLEILALILLFINIFIKTDTPIDVDKTK